MFLGLRSLQLCCQSLIQIDVERGDLGFKVSGDQVDRSSLAPDQRGDCGVPSCSLVMWRGSAPNGKMFVLPVASFGRGSPFCKEPGSSIFGPNPKVENHRSSTGSAESRHVEGLSRVIARKLRLSVSHRLTERSVVQVSSPGFLQR